MSGWRIEKYVRVDAQGRIVIPKQVREQFDLAEGSQLKFIATSDDNQEMILKKV